MDDLPQNQHNDPAAFSKNVADKEVRKMKARRARNRSIWFGLGVSGFVGWSVAIPMLIGIGLGIWIDTHWPSQISWTLTLLLAGVVLGCLNAWYWITRERQVIEQEDAGDNEKDNE
jgi:ATP synthase protein I